MLTKELIVKIDDLAIECEDTYSMANRIEDMLEEIFNDHEAQLKAKDKEIERLNCRAYHTECYISDLHNHPKDKKFYDAKARSIVAMLFWESKRCTKLGITLSSNSMYRAFKKAYAMLKDNKR